MALHGVILDIDGTLINSNEAHARAWVDALDEHGFKVGVDRMRELIGKGGDKVLPEVTNIAKDSPQGQEISERRTEIFKERYLPHLKRLPGTHELLQHMRSQGLKLVVATSANEDEVEQLLQIAGANDLIEERTTSSDVNRSKPDPDIVHVALERLGAPPEQAVMLGDTPWDIKACQQAGVPIIAFRSGGWDDLDLRGAAEIYDDPADLLAHYEQSLLGGSNGEKH